MRKLTYVLSVAAAVAVTAPVASAQFPVIDRSRVETRNGDVYTKVPKGHLPPRGMCRVWVDGVPPGQQPAVTDCATAERQRYRYGSGARVLYGNDASFPGKGKHRAAATSRRYETVIDGRTCLARERLLNGLNVFETDCDRDGRWDNASRRGDDDDDRRFRRSGATRRVDGDYEKARQKQLKQELKEQKHEAKQLQKANKGHGKGHGKGNGKKG